jgi:hypothetical protein
LGSETLCFEPVQTLSGRKKSFFARYELQPKRYRLQPKRYLFIPRRYLIHPRRYRLLPRRYLRIAGVSRPEARSYGLSRET